MSKIPRPAQAFSRRVQMSKIGLFVIVEGRNSDRSFYDRMLANNELAKSRGYSIRLAEEISLDGRSSGGKPFAYQLFEYFTEEGVLTQYNSEGSRTIAFMLDKDVEDLALTARSSPHIVYTTAADVEAEIVSHARVEDAVCATYSITRELCRKAIPEGPSIVSALAAAWRSWIHLRVVSEAFGVAADGVHHAGPSIVNERVHGPEVPTKVLRLWEQLEAKIGSQDAAAKIAQKRSEIDAIYACGQDWSLVKGKWVAALIHHRISVRLSDEVLQSNIQANSVFGPCLETLDFQDPWSRAYHQKLDNLLS